MIKIQYGKFQVEMEATDIITILREPETKEFVKMATEKLVEALVNTVGVFAIPKIQETIKNLDKDKLIMKEPSAEGPAIT